eukprot:4909910-Prymnesium_polylepis.1
MQQRGAHDRHCSLVKRAVKEELLKPRYRAVPVASVIDEVLNAQGLESQICNSIYLREQSRSEASSSGCGGSGTAAGASSSDSAAPATVRASMQPDDLDVVVEMRQRWGRMIVQNLRKLNEETGQSLLRIRQEGEAAHDRWRGKRMQKQPAKFLYEPSDLVEAVSQARHPNGGSGHCRVLSWGISPIRVRTLTLAQLRERFVDLSVQERQTGVDDELRGWFEEERHAEGQRLLANGYTSLLEQFAKRGVPSGLRARVWLALLRVDVGERERPPQSRTAPACARSAVPPGRSRRLCRLAEGDHARRADHGRAAEARRRGPGTRGAVLCVCVDGRGAAPLLCERPPAGVGGKLVRARACARAGHFCPALERVRWRRARFLTAPPRAALLYTQSRDPRVHQAAAHPQHSTIIARCADGSQTAFPPSASAALLCLSDAVDAVLEPPALVQLAWLQPAPSLPSFRGAYAGAPHGTLHTFDAPRCAPHDDRAALDHVRLLERTARRADAASLGSRAGLRFARAAAAAGRRP